MASTRSPATVAPGAAASRVVPNTDPLGAASGVALRFAGAGPFTTRGPRSGRVYACGTAGSVVLVDPRDVDALLRTRLFTRGT